MVKRKDKSSSKGSEHTREITQNIIIPDITEFHENLIAPHSEYSQTSLSSTHPDSQTTQDYFLSANDVCGEFYEGFIAPSHSDSLFDEPSQEIGLEDLASEPETASVPVAVSASEPIPARISVVDIPQDSAQPRYPHEAPSNLEYDEMPEFKVSLKDYVNTIRELLHPVTRRLAPVTSFAKKGYGFMKKHPRLSATLGASLGIIGVGLLANDYSGRKVYGAQIGDFKVSYFENIGLGIFGQNRNEVIIRDGNKSYTLVDSKHENGVDFSTAVDSSVRLEKVILQGKARHEFIRGYIENDIQRQLGEEVFVESDKAYNATRVLARNKLRGDYIGDVTSAIEAIKKYTGEAERADNQKKDSDKK